MATKKPLVLYGASKEELRSGDSLAGGVSLASTTEVLTGTDAAKAVTPDALAALWEQGSNVASASTISLGEGGYFFITGTTTITDIDFATDKAGRPAWVKFAGALTLTHNSSTLILPGGANITTAAGDTACFISEGSDVVRCVEYVRAASPPQSGTNTGDETAARIATIIHGATAKAIPVLADQIIASDSEASWAAKEITLEGVQAAVRPPSYPEPFRKYPRMLFIGNSFTLYPPDSSIWWGTWGMAASKKSKDYVHQLAAMMTNFSPDMVLDPHYCRDWEIAHHTFTLSSYDSFFTTKPDGIVIQLGSNVSDATNYQADFINLILYCRSKAPAAKIFVLGNPWTNATLGNYVYNSLDVYQYNAAVACGVQYIGLELLDTSANRSQIGNIVYDDSGGTHAINNAAVAAHFGDSGHLGIATNCFNGICGTTGYKACYKIDAGRNDSVVTAGWIGDSGLFLLGSRSSTDLTINTSLIYDPPPDVTWDTQHYGSHQIVLPGLALNSNYLLELFTAENGGTPSAGRRTFSIAVNGVSKNLTGPASTGATYDAYVQAGSVANKGTAATATVTTSVNGVLVIDFTTTSTDPGQIMGLRLTKVV